MTAAPMLMDMARRGITVRPEGDRLRILGKPTEADLALLRAHKRELLALLTEADRLGLPHVLLHRLSADDLAACAELSAPTLGAFLRALDAGERMDAGATPPGFTAAKYCQGCGPVWLWPSAPDRVIACPWCKRRKAGLPFPRP